MARPVWRGSLSLGLVTVPVELYSATSQHQVHFHQFQRGTSDRIRIRRVNERTGKEVGQDDIVKGYDLGGGEYVMVEPDELDELAPERSRRIDIEQFVELSEIDPWQFDRTYWLQPAKEEFAKAYGLLLKAMAHNGKVGVAKFVLRDREYLAVVRAHEGVLALNTLHFPEDLREPELPELPRTRPKEMDMAEALVEQMSGPWQPEDYHDTYTERVRELLKAKQAGEEITREEPREETGEVVDLFEALSRSVERRKKKRDLSGLSKADLEKLAREKGVKGRSKMTRDELEKALKAS